MEDLYLTIRINRKHNIHSHKYTHKRTFTSTYTHTINRNIHGIDYIINWKKINLICLFNIDTHSYNIHAHIKYRNILYDNNNVEDNVMHTVSWWNTNIVKTQY